MKILKKIIAIVLVAIVAISCSKDETSEPQVRTNLLLRTIDDDGLISTYTYDGSNRLVNYKLNGNINNAPRDYNFTYNADGTLNEITEANSTEIISKLFYNSDKKIIRNEGRNGFDVYLYTYNGNIITENYRRTDTNIGFRQVYTYDVNSNISNVTIYTNTSDANPLGTYDGDINYTYDTKNNAASSLPVGFRFPSSVNNIKTTQYNGGGIGTSNYEYNADNYPTKRTGGFTRIYEYQRL